MKISTVIGYLESLAPLSYQEDFDNAGLISGDPGHKLSGLLVCLDVTPQVMEEAIRKQCNLVISHHPFIFHSFKKLLPDDPVTTILTRAIRTDTAIYACHTNLDNILEGLNAHVIKGMGVTDYKVLRPVNSTLTKLVAFCPVEHAQAVRDALFRAGAGHIGNFDQCSFNVAGNGTFRAYGTTNPFIGTLDQQHQEPETRIEVILENRLKNKVVEALLASHPYKEAAYDLYPLSNTFAKAGSGLVGCLPEPVEETQFLAKVKELVKIPCIRHSEWRKKPIRKIALCTGSGSFLIPDALKAEADIFLTADLKYHDFFVPSGRMMVADIGHYESEVGVKEWLHAKLIEKFPTFALFISETNTNPVHYFNR